MVSEPMKTSLPIIVLFSKAVIVTGLKRLYIDILTYLGIADISKVRYLATSAYLGFLDFAKASDFDFVISYRTGPYISERPNIIFPSFASIRTVELITVFLPI